MYDNLVSGHRLHPLAAHAEKLKFLTSKPCEHIFFSHFEKYLISLLIFSHVFCFLWQYLNSFDSFNPYVLTTCNFFTVLFLPVTLFTKVTGEKSTVKKLQVV